MRSARLLPSVGLFAVMLTIVTANAQDPPPAKAEPKKETKPDPRVVAQQLADKKALDSAGLKTDDVAGLIGHLKNRTLSTEQVGKITSLVQKMHADAPFDERIAAQEEVLKIGGQAADVLRREAKENPDAEIRFRAWDTLRRLTQEKQSGPELTAAVVRALRSVRSDEVAPALLAYLPLADGPALADAIQEAVTANAGTDGKPSPAVVKALDDPSPLTRQVAAVALASGGTSAQRVRFPSAYPKLLEIAKSDREHAVRFAVTKALLLDAREKQAVAALIDLLPGMTRGQSWQAEELLAQVAGKDSPKERCKHLRDPSNPTRESQASKESRTKCRDAWKAWWDKASAATDLNKVDLQLTVKGELVAVSQSWANMQQVHLIEYGADEKEKGRSTFPNNSGNLFDAAIRDDGIIVTMDQYNNQIQLRDTSGKVTKVWQVKDAAAARFGFQPRGMELLDNGHLIAYHQNGFTEFDKDGKQVIAYARPEVNKGQPRNDLWGGVRMKNGETVVLILNQNQGELIVLDAKGKELADRKPVKLPGQPYYRNTLIQTGDDKVMLYDQNNNRMQEIDLKTGKVDAAKWSGLNSPMSIQRLPNGNLLFAEYNRLSERAVDGSEVWSTTNRDTSGNSQFLRTSLRAPLSPRPPVFRHPIHPHP
ncbi:MAG: HEAT repeat domain-containing protein [Fimbriiglobus sp.]|jgi:hypothetical protein|nr:HEAT repeat domain-containing protein [Fimbriiglobus sp.]